MVYSPASVAIVDIIFELYELNSLEMNVNKATGGRIRGMAHHGLGLFGRLKMSEKSFSCIFLSSIKDSTGFSWRCRCCEIHKVNKTGLSDHVYFIWFGFHQYMI